jgi:phenylacetate-CoA ligase
MDEVFARFPEAQGTAAAAGRDPVRRRAADAGHGPGADGRPRLLLLDEPSLGLAPLITDEIFSIIHQLARGGTTILIVEQNAARALSASDTAYLLAGRPHRRAGQKPRPAPDPALRAAFLGAASHDNPSASRLGAAGLTNIRLEKPPCTKTSCPPLTLRKNSSAHQLQGTEMDGAPRLRGLGPYRAKLEAAGITPDDPEPGRSGRCPSPPPTICATAIPSRLRACPSSSWCACTPVPAPRASARCSATRKRISTTGPTCSPAATRARGHSLDRVQIAVGYGVWTAGMGFQLGCEKVGAMAVPVGPGNIDMHIQFLLDFQSTVFCSTASMALLMAEEIHKRGIADKIAIKRSSTAPNAPAGPCARRSPSSSAGPSFSTSPA